MKEIELIGKRKPREKHFLREKGIIEAQVFDEDIHFLKDGTYEEIDNTLIDMGNYYTNKNNAYKVTFAKTSKDELTKISIGDNYIKTKLVNCNLSQIKENIMESKLHKNVCYPDILNNIDLEYNIMPAKVKEAIILKSKDVDLEKLVFSIETNMELELLDKKIVARSNDEACFEFDIPYMIDAEFKINNNISYILDKIEIGQYKLSLEIDNNWLNDENTKYPVMIDPTITNSNQDGSVYDTYIYPGDTGVNRNGEDKLKVGVEKINGVDRVNRALLRFSLPTIGTGSQVIRAGLYLVGYPQETYSIDCKTVTVHQITKDWNEDDADWNSMNDKYNSRVEGAIESRRGYYDYQNNTIVPVENSCDLTNLVRKWYTGTPNYGVMLKTNIEQYDSNIFPIFYSKNNSVIGANPKPILSISYRNQNGIEDYMDYQKRDFNIGSAYVNSYNGNLTTIFNIGSTIGGKMPAILNLIYNTNDVVLNNNVGYGMGYRLSLQQIIKEQHIDNETYLEYTDEDGTLHYFLNKRSYFDDTGYNTIETGNIYYDEDGLELTITKNDNDYILKDKNGNTMKFIKNGSIAYLSEIKNTSGNKIVLTYDENSKIVKIVDADNAEINITYNTNNIIIASPDGTVNLNYLNNRLISINNYLGETNFEYNENNIISKITDIDGIKTVYEYYEQKPYKVSKVSEFGLENTLGEYFNILYGFDSTTIIDSDGKAKNIIFNSQGSIVSVSNLKEKDNIKNAYGISEINGTKEYPLGYNNKLIRAEIPIKYVNNLLSNTSFEKNEINFIGTQNVSINISDEISKTGINSLKAISTINNESLTQSVNVSKGENYTFSAYIKNTNKVRLSLSYKDESNVLVEKQSETILPNEEFERYDITINYPKYASSDLFIKIYMEEIGTIYIDDIQLELGEVANNYNLLENSDFSQGFSDWELSCSDFNTGESLPINDKFEIVALSDGSKALKTKMNLAHTLNMRKTFNIKGKAGDVFNISFWYKYEGIITYDYMNCGSRVGVNFMYSDPDLGHCGVFSSSFNPNDESWQYVSNEFVAEYDYDSIIIDISHLFDANNFYITNLSLFKDIRSVYYEYDENGNIILENNLDNKSTNFNYDKNNQLIQMTNPKGKNFAFEYDNIVSDRVINGISDMGISNVYRYDSNNNPVLTKVVKNGIIGDISNGLYKIRLKGTSNYLRNISNEIKIINEDCSHDLWGLEKVDEFFKIRHNIISDKYLTILNNNIVLSNENGDNSLFKLNKNKNGSYLIKLKSEDKYLKYSDQGITIATLIEDDHHFEFYFETVDSNVFIENSAVYTNGGRFLSKITDTSLRETTYSVDNITGKVTKIINSLNQITNYDYDNKNRLISVSTGDKTINYQYNNKNYLKKIIEGEKEYIFEYDEFNNIIKISLGENIIFIHNKYGNNNGNLSSVTYGNGDQIIYEYDEFDRISKFIKMDKVYNYKYDSNGNLVRVYDDINNIKYVYDLAQRLVKYICNDYQVNYKYDVNENIINISNKLGALNNVINNTFNDDDAIIQTNFDLINVNYQYDDLGRLKNRNIDNNYNTEYQYWDNGKRASLLIKNILDGNTKFSYDYDKGNNIRKININDIESNKYYYDEYNQLVKEIDYNQKQTIKYKYDQYGNILYKKYLSNSDYSVLKYNKYEYSNVWKDQLIKFNNISILYDEIGNTINIGDDIELEWKNGRELSSYKNGNKIVSYKYNKDGIRILKTRNNIETNYYLDDMQIIYEKTGNNVLYYMYNDVDDLIGFKYNDVVYYYKKNIQDDIIGILDSEFNLIANYCYDSFGKIISISDGNNNDISKDENHIANINPFRYRSYYYDVESGLYYLNNRYYNPEWGRFINSDKIINENEDILGQNLYAYCSNNFINCSDYTGNGLISNIVKKIKKIFSKISATKKSSSKKPKKNSAKKIKAGSSKAKTKTSTGTNNGHNNLPIYGPPNKTLQKPNGDFRSYGPDGKAKTDTDYNHPERHPDLPNPHAHDWTWNGNAAKRGPAYDPNVGKFALGTIVTVGTGYLVYRGFRMLPSLFPPLWWTIPINAATP